MSLRRDGSGWMPKTHPTTAIQPLATNHSQRLILDPETASPSLCPGCQKIFLKDLIIHDEQGQIQPRPQRALDELHHNSNSICQAADNGCYICHWLVRVRCAHTIKDFMVEATNENGKIRDLVFVIAYNKAQPAVAHLSLLDFPQSELAVYSIKARSMAQTSSGSHETLELAKHWLETCRSTHKVCDKAGVPWYPTRLLQLRHGKAFLIKTQEHTLTRDYASLSHCWGTELFYNLTSATINELSHGVEISRFLPTFRQAMHVCLSLGMDLIWIDSYCIIQGRDELAQADWGRESGNMLHVYSNAAVNLAAAGSHGPKGGLFHDRSPELSSPIIECKTLDGGKSLYTLTRDRFDQYRSYYVDQDPLWTRAWVFQERLVCRRLLSFAGNHIRWSCRHSNDNEGFTFLSKWKTDFGTLLDPREFWQRYMNTSRKIDDDGGMRGQDWRRLVAAYTKLLLTFPSKDKLKAIAGIMQFMETRDNDKLVSGHQLAIMTASLGWTMTSAGPAKRTSPQPSWSWASSESPVDLPFVYTAIGGLAMIVWPRCADDLTGYEGQLLCIGRLLPVSILDDSGASQRVGNEKWSVEVSFDYQSEKEDLKLRRRQIWLLPLSYGPENEQNTKYDKTMDYWLLVLVQLEPGVFQRVGISCATAGHEIEHDGKIRYERFSEWFRDHQATKPRLFTLR